MVARATRALSIGFVLLLGYAPAVDANSISVLCGKPTLHGEVGFVVNISVPFLGVRFLGAELDDVFGDSAAEKCQAMAAAMQEQLESDPTLSDVSVSVSGNVLTITASGGDFIDNADIAFDHSGEFTALSAPIGPGGEVRIDEFFADAAGIPPAGFDSALFIKAPIFGTFGVQANGVDDGATTVGRLNASFTALTGIAFDRPIMNGSTQIGWSTPFFDPTTVEIGWDGNTALHLANFGLAFERPSRVPEPGTLMLFACAAGLATLGTARRRTQTR
jgi:hypothetical protein